MDSSSSKGPPYPGGMGPYTGRDPNVKKPEWLRQKAPQGEKYEEVKESLSRLKLNTVCEEAQCPNIGEVLFLSKHKQISSANNGLYFLFVIVVLMLILSTCDYGANIDDFIGKGFFIHFMTHYFFVFSKSRLSVCHTIFFLSL